MTVDKADFTTLRFSWQAPRIQTPFSKLLTLPDFTDAHIDTIELMLERLYTKWGLNDGTDFSKLSSGQFPILSDLYEVIEDAYEHYDAEPSPLYPRDLLREILLGLHSLCRGAESKFFNGHTNITSSRFQVFGVKELLHASHMV